jgi:hypothetical protein
MTMRKEFIIAACSLAMAACAPSYVYRPAANATATMKGRAAADYPIPPTSPQGDVRLASFGMTNVSSSGTPGKAQKAIHVRMIVADNSQTPWTLDASKQLVALPGGQQLAPAYVTTHDGEAGLPSVTVPAGGKRILDLLYALPPDMQSASQVPEFDVVWHVATPQQQVSERTPFDRLRVDPEVVGASDPYWSADERWGGPFWYDPYIPGYRSDVLIGAPRWGGWGRGRGHLEAHGGRGGFGHGGGHGGHR